MFHIFYHRSQSKCQTFMPYGNWEAEGVYPVSVLASLWPLTDEPVYQTARQSASQELPLPLAARQSGGILNLT